MKSRIKQGITSYNVGGRVVPIALIFFGVWTLLGCIYLPFPQHASTKTEKDFRPYFQSVGPDFPFQPGKITRAQIIQLLGRPTEEDEKNRAIFYDFRSESDLFVVPLCFYASPGRYFFDGVRFDFDDAGTLVSWERADTKTDLIAWRKPHATR